MDIEVNKAQRIAYLRGIDDAQFKEAVLDQMNSLRLQKVNLVDDMDVILNGYDSVCKKFPIKAKKKK
ncbi:MAG TPA: hypothetical protein DCX27_23110 [Balneola sp.]|nr:hypothetical protein [Balneola sp.]